jgi:hypothetical protein
MIIGLYSSVQEACGAMSLSSEAIESGSLSRHRIAPMAPAPAAFAARLAGPDTGRVASPRWSIGIAPFAGRHHVKIT